MSFRQGILCQIKEYQIKINKHDSEHLILSKYYLYGAPQIKDILKKKNSFRHGIWVVTNSNQETIWDTLYLESTMYRVDHAKSNIVSILTEQGKFPE